MFCYILEYHVRVSFSIVGVCVTLLYLFVCMYIYICVCVYVYCTICLCIHMYIHTHIHIIENLLTRVEARVCCSRVSIVDYSTGSAHSSLAACG